MLRIDQEDLAQECNAYMKIKHFMANRIAELESQVDKLQKAYSLQLMSNLALNDLLQSYNFLKLKIQTQECKCKPSKLDLSKDSIESIPLKKNDDSRLYSKGVFYNEVDDEIYLEDRPDEAQNIKDHKENFNVDKEKLIENSTYEIICQNIKLSEENVKLKNDLDAKNFNLSKLMTEKVLLINELRELLNSLNKIEFKNLDKLFLINTEISKKVIKIDSMYKLDVPSSLGIKYNILSAYSMISSQIFSNLQPEGETGIQASSLLEGIINSRKIFKFFEKEFENILNRNLTKQSILKEYDDLED
jgi:hypothetical protein